MKSWADCSSDEDTDDNYSVDSEDQNAEQSTEDAFSAKVKIDDNEEGPDGEGTGQPVRTYDFPDRPPFTAFVGNLSYDIQESSQLQKALADVVFDRLGERVNVLGGRISYDRDSKNRQHRGFGYVELETLEQLKTVMRLNDDEQALLAGRKVQVDTANHNNNRPNNNNNRRGSYNNNQRGSFHRQSNDPVEEIDGTKFRGGKFNNNNSNSNTNNNNQRNNSFRNNSGHNSFQNTQTSGDTPRQRPSLKLAARSKRVDGEERSSSSNIFGGAKARDEQAWEKGRQQQDQQASGGDEKKKTAIASKKGGEDNNSNNNKSTGKDKKMEHQDRRQSGRGGGRGGKGRGNNQRGGNNNAGRGDQNNQNNKRGSGRRQSHQQHDKKNDKRQQQPAPEAKAATVAKANNKQMDTTPSNPEAKAPKNKFSLLMDDSDSD